MQLIVDGAHDAALCWLQGSEGWLDVGGACAAFVDRSQAPPEVDDPEGHGLISSRMHGALVKLAVEVGQRVRKGEFVLAIEAMKMEHRIEAPVAGTVVELGAARRHAGGAGTHAGAHRSRRGLNTPGDLPCPNPPSCTAPKPAWPR